MQKTTFANRNVSWNGLVSSVIVYLGSFPVSASASQTIAHAFQVEPQHLLSCAVVIPCLFLQFHKAQQSEVVTAKSTSIGALLQYGYHVSGKSGLR